MALPEITTEDFKGYYKLALNEFKSEDLENYITLFTEKNLREVIGDAAFSDMSSQDFQKWTDLNNGVDFVDVNGIRRRLTGLKELLIGFIYFEFVRDNFTTTTVGKVKGKSEASERATDIEVATVARSRYNLIICKFNEGMVRFLKAYESLTSLIDISYDLGDNRYVLIIDSPVYLDTGLIAEIGSTEYQVTELQNFTVNAGATGLDFTGDQAVWNFEETVGSSDNTSGTEYQLTVDSTEGLSVGQTVNVDGTDYVVLDLIADTCFSIDGGTTGLDFAGLLAVWSFSTTVVTSVDLTDNTYLLSVQDSTYVAVGAEVEIDAADYSILELSSGYLIDAASTGLDFSGDSIEWKPFEYVDFEEVEIAGL